MPVQPPLDPDFQPAALARQHYAALTARDPGRRLAGLALTRPDGTVFRHELPLLSATHPHSELTFRHVERTLKLLLWQQGGNRVHLAGASEVANQLQAQYRPSGIRAFDYEFMGEKIFGGPFALIAADDVNDLPAARTTSLAVGCHLDGCRIGFDLGGSDRKVAAVIDGEVVFAEETRWDPYFQSDPAYHLAGIQESLERAAAHLPRVDAIGGSAAGVYVNNEVRVASLFRGVSPADFDRHIRRLFFTLRERWGGVPFVVANDGEVTALAASMSLGVNGVLGLSLGTSQAAGYVTPEGGLTSWLNELAFAPIDHRLNAPRDEWSGDAGCGVQYFSQQAVARLAPSAGFSFPCDLPLPERLVQVQEAMRNDDPRAKRIYESIGAYLSHALALYADFYAYDHALILGRVTSGAGGDVILREARRVLSVDYPELGERLYLHTPDEKNKRHGQAIAAASLPALR